MTTQLTIPTNALSVQEIQPFIALTFGTQATLRTIQEYNHIPQALYDEAARLGLTPTGPIQYVYTDASGDVDHTFGLEIVLPVDSAAGQPGTFALKTVESFRCVSYTFAGPWDAFVMMYNALFATINQAGYQTSRQIREVYSVVDFESPANCVTAIQVGLV